MVFEKEFKEIQEYLVKQFKVEQELEKYYQNRLILTAKIYSQRVR
jgi:hypothetical protein